MKQQCRLWSVWLTWVALPVVALLAFFSAGWPAAVAVVVAGVGWQLLYTRFFPRFSSAMGYGSVADVAADPAVAPLPAGKVTLYTANLCPFCPLVRARLVTLQQRLGFELIEIDVTFRPELVTSKNLRAVPVIEAGGRVWVGNATSAQLLSFLADGEGAGARQRGDLA